MNNTNDLALAVARLFLSGIFIWSGIGKVMAYAGTAAFMERMGVPGLLLPLVILLEIGGGVAILLGWQTRWAALALAGFCIAASLLFHLDLGNTNQTIALTKNIAIAGGFLALWVAGPGRLSIDGRTAA